MANSGRHDAPLPAPTQTTFAQNVGRLLYVAVQGVGHNGSRGKTAATIVGRVRLRALACFYLAKTHITTNNNQSIRPDPHHGDDDISAKYKVTSSRY
jgi:hypothetical protein